MIVGCPAWSGAMSHRLLCARPTRLRPPAPADGAHTMSAARRPEGKWREAGSCQAADRGHTAPVSAAQRRCGRARIRTWVGEAGGLCTSQTRLPGSPRIPTRPRLSLVTCPSGWSTVPAILGVPARAAPSRAARRRAERNPTTVWPEFRSYGRATRAACRRQQDAVESGEPGSAGLGRSGRSRCWRTQDPQVLGRLVSAWSRDYGRPSRRDARVQWSSCLSSMRNAS